jgi:hypothetical protein
MLSVRAVYVLSPLQLERIHLGLARGDKADMCSSGVRIALSQPEENATVSSKALEVGMSFGAILTVVIDGMHDTERLESRLVKGDRSSEIFDGYEDVVEQEFTSFQRPSGQFPKRRLRLPIPHSSFPNPSSLAWCILGASTSARCLILWSR